MRLADGRAEVASADAVFQRNETLTVLAVDIGRTGFQLHLAEVAQRDIGGGRFRVVARQRHRDRADGLDIAAIFRREPDSQRKVILAFVDPGDFLAADRRLHDCIDVSDREAVACRFAAIDAHTAPFERSGEPSAWTMSPIYSAYF